MNDDEVRQLASKGFFDHKRISGKVETTHISWVILASKYAFKIKKPVKLSFLDFSTLELRKEYCERELLLNSRLSGIYLEVAPVRLVDGVWIVGGDEGDVHDYCVVMKRMATGKRMDNRLRAGEVTRSMIQKLAEVIAGFHNNAARIDTPFEVTVLGQTFNDIDSVKPFVVQKMGRDYGDIIDKSIAASDTFLHRHAVRLKQRSDLGFRRDLHGDLHSGNIFLYKKPVVFDCIEFNDQYRQIDVLYETAFLCMDLEAFGRRDLAEHFLTVYQKYFPCFQTMEDELLFVYFKSLRANIRAKVHAVAAEQAQTDDQLVVNRKKAERYMKMLAQYVSEFIDRDKP